MVGKNDRSGVARSRGQGINRTCISTRGVSFRVSRKYLKFVPRTPTRCARYSALIFSFFFLSTFAEISKFSDEAISRALRFRQDDYRLRSD